MKIFSFILVLFLQLTLTAQNRELKLVTDAWPPFTDFPGNKSILTTLTQEALYRTGVNSDMTIIEFANVAGEIDKGVYDGCPAYWETEERLAKYHFSKPYMYNQLILVGRKGSAVTARSFTELEGKRIGIVQNYAYGNFEGREGVEIVEGKSNQHNLENLLSDKIDYMLVDALLIQYMLKYQLNDVTAHLAIGQTPMMVKSLHLAIHKQVEGGAEILKAFDEEITEMRKDGTFNRILEFNWVKADIDGDGNMELVLGGELAGTSAPENIYGLMMDQTFMENNSPNRYYIDGKLYESWDDVPKSYKLDLPVDDTPSEKDVPVKLKF